MNKRHQYRELEREYITTDISIRALCRKHDISAHSLVSVQAKKLKWAEKREQYQVKADQSFMSRHSEKMADRQAEISDKFLDATDQALDKFMADLKATKSVRQPDGSIVEMPAWYMTPRDLCLLIDRFQVLFARPSSISQHQGFSVTSELSAESLREFIEATRGRAGPPRREESPLPRARRLDD